MDSPDVHVFQCMEELLQSILKEMDLSYLPHYSNATNESGMITIPITSSIILVGRDLYELFGNHIEHLLLTLPTEKCEAYVNLFGDYAFNETEFSWSLFRVFLTFISVLSTSAYKTKDVGWTDELITCTARYMERKLSQHIGKSEAWKDFDQDSAKLLLRSDQSGLTETMKPPSSREKPQLFVNMADSTSDFARAAERPCSSTTAAESVKNDFTFPKSVGASNTTADSLKQPEKECYLKMLITGGPVDYNNPRIQVSGARCYNELIAHVAQLSVKALSEI